MSSNQCERAGCAHLASHAKHRTALPTNVDELAGAGTPEPNQAGSSLTTEDEDIKPSVATPSPRVRLLSLPDDALLLVGTHLVEDVWQAREKLDFLASIGTYDPRFSWKDTSSADVAWQVLAPLAHCNKRLRQIFERLMWQSVTLAIGPKQTADDLMEKLQTIGTFVHVLHVIDADDRFREIVDQCPNLHEVAMSFNPNEPKISKLAFVAPDLGNFIVDLARTKLDGLIRTVQVFGRAGGHALGFANASPLTIASLSTFSNVTSLVFGERLYGSSFRKERATHLAHQLLVAQACKHVKLLDLTVSARHLPTDEDLQKCQKFCHIESLTLRWVTFHRAAKADNMHFLLSRFQNIQLLELHFAGPFPDWPESFDPDYPFLGKLHDLRVSGASLESVQFFIQDAGLSSLSHLAIHDDHEIFDIRNGHDQRLLRILKASRDLEALLRKQGGRMEEMRIHVHREHNVRAGRENSFAGETVESESLLPKVLGPACQELGAKLELVVHP